MEKTEKCYHYFIGLSILFGILFICVFVRLHSEFSYPSSNELFHLLRICQYSLLVGFILSISLAIALKSILKDLDWKLIGLSSKIDDLNKKLLELEKNR
ncbi:hypothetical protein [Proteiniborus sp. MB09-C3]|uniref:hypothetical protein n=1 Tax=Proteiniborus sp. MB09-C3 TaxID=3050072 RepID=UPI0025565E1B|nr:hypothetical protein [Proteiniborus sp. MB09-C3]WIV12743.1 hypothetical protein QO263_03240 [Proteiniborus sp. MB09-C3]